MTIALTLWHFVPWWVWPIILAAVIVLLEVPGALGAVLRVLKLVPWQVYVVAAVALAGGLWLQWHDDELTREITVQVTAERDEFWQAREDAANKAHEQALAALQLKLDTSLNAAREAARRHAQQLAAERDKLRAAQAQLDEARHTNVTPEADRACVLTRGVVRQFTLATSIANREQPASDRSAAGTRSVDVDAPSGVALSELSHANDDNAAAYRACRVRVDAWESYHATVIKPWIASTLEVVSSCIPKGAS